MNAQYDGHGLDKLYSDIEESSNMPAHSGSFAVVCDQK
jgi:hypothetical protein